MERSGRISGGIFVLLVIGGGESFGRSEQVTRRGRRGGGGGHRRRHARLKARVEGRARMAQEGPPVPPAAPIGSAAASLAGLASGAITEVALRAAFASVQQPTSFLMHRGYFLLLVWEAQGRRNWGFGRSRAAARRRRKRFALLGAGSEEFALDFKGLAT